MPTATATKAAVRDGVRMNYLDLGGGDPALLFIHGWSGDSRLWEKQLEAFAPGHRVVAVDLRGHGQSDKPEQGYTVPAFASDVAWLSREIGLDHPVIIGHSMGGAIALEIVRSRPDFARAVVFVDAPLGPLPEDLRPLVSEILEGLRSPNYRDVAVHFTGLLFSEDSDPAVKSEVLAGLTAVPQHVMHTAFASTLSTLPQQDKSEGSLPVRALYVRAQTQVVTEDQLRFRFPGMAVTTVDAAHFLHMEKPAEFNDILRDFLLRIE
jgi:pimeloyl-ACP methyl ester carboxylesterase